jgi:hypothetical protein
VATQVGFDKALAAMINDGACARRAGWNGKGMYVYWETRFRIPDADHSFDPCFVLFTAQGTHQPGWVAAQPDLAAQDWEILKPLLPND